MNFVRHPQERNSLKRLWDKYNPLISVIGGIILIGYYAGTYQTKFEAYGHTLDEHAAILTSHEKHFVADDAKLDRIDQHLQDIIDFWNIPSRIRPSRATP